MPLTLIVESADVLSPAASIALAVRLSGEATVPGMNLYLESELPILAIQTTGDGFLFGNQGYHDAWLETPHVAAALALSDAPVAAPGLLAILTLDATNAQRGAYTVTAHDVAGWLNSDFITATPSYLDGETRIVGDLTWNGDCWTGSLPHTPDQYARVKISGTLTTTTMQADWLTIGGTITVPEPSPLPLLSAVLAVFIVRLLFHSLK